jgi:hypothetical protein
MITGTLTAPSSGLNMDQLNDLLGNFKSDIMGGIDERFSSFQPASAPSMPDYSNQFSGLEQRLAGLETQIGGIQMPQYEPADYSGQFGGLEDKIAGIEQQLSSLPTPAGVDYNKISSLVSDQVNQAVGGIEIPGAPDMSAFNDRFDRIDQRLDGLPQYQEPDLSALTGQIGDLKTQFDSFQPQQVDLSGLTGQIGGLQNQLDGFMNDDRFKGDSFAQIDPAIMDQLTQTNASLGEQIMGLDNRLDQINLAQQNMGPGLTPDQLDQHLSAIDDRFGSFDQRFDEAINREDPFVTALNSIQNGDYQFNIGDQNYDFSNLFPHVDPIAPDLGNGGGGNAFIPPWSPGPSLPPTQSPTQPPPSTNPSLPPQVADPVDWNRYGRDYGELDFNVGGTAGGAPAVQGGQGGFDLSALLGNLGL